MEYIISEVVLNQLENNIKALMENEYSCSDCGALELLEEIKSDQSAELVAEGDLRIFIYDNKDLKQGFSKQFTGKCKIYIVKVGK